MKGRSPAGQFLWQVLMLLAFGLGCQVVTKGFWAVLSIVSVNPATVTVGTVSSSISVTVSPPVNCTVLNEIRLHHGGASGSAFASNGGATLSDSYFVPNETSTPGEIGIKYGPPGQYPVEAEVVGSGCNVDPVSLPGFVQATVPTGGPIIISSQELPALVEGLPYRFQLEAVGGTAPYTWSPTPQGQALPAGLTLSSAGLLSAAAAPPPGLFLFTCSDITVRDAANVSQSREFCYQHRSTGVTLSPGSVTAPAFRSITPVPVGVPFSYTIPRNSTSTSPLQFFSSRRPSWLTLTAAGVLQGTPVLPSGATSGPVVVPVEVEVSQDASESGDAHMLYLVLTTPVVVTPAVIGPAQVGVPFSLTLSASGGLGPYRFEFAGSPPAGFTLTGNQLSGTPTAAGNVSFTIRATDSGYPAQSGERPYTLVVNPALALPPVSFPTAVTGVPLADRTIAATGGTPGTGGTYTYLVTSGGGLPPGITVRTAQGAAVALNTPVTTTGLLVGGTPTAAGSYPFAVQATDAHNPAQVRRTNYSILVATPLTLTPATLPAGQAGVAYGPVTLQPGGGFSNSGATYSLTVSGLPPGVTTEPVPNGNGALRLTGTPTTAATYTVTVRVQQNSTSGAFPVPLDRTYSIMVRPAVTLSPATVPNGQVGVAYTSTLITASGGTPGSGGTYTYAVSGTLPPGLSIAPLGSSASGVTLSGTPTTTGTYSFEVAATDAFSSPQTARQPYTVTIAPAGLSLSPAAIPSAAQAGVAYGPVALTAAGGTPGPAGGYRYTVLGGALPPGITLAPSGTESPTARLQGTPTTAGTYEFTVQASDFATSPQTASRTYTITVAPPLTITPPTLPPGQVGVAYSQTIAASGGTPLTGGTYQWSLLSGTLPPGLSLPSPEAPTASVALTGTPTVAGTYRFTLQAQDGFSPPQTVSREFTLVVAPPGLTLAPQTLVAGQAGTAYGPVTFAATGGTPFTGGLYRYEFSGTLPNGMSFTPALPSGAVDAVSLSLGGTPVQGGTFTFTVTVRDAGNPEQVTSRTYSLSIASTAVTLAPASLPAGQVGAAYTQTVAATGGLPGSGGTYTYEVVSGSLPPGLTVTPLLSPTATVALTGTPTAAGSFTFTLAARDTSVPVQTGAQTYTVAISPSSLQLTPASLPDARVGVPYGAQTLAATGGVPGTGGTYTYTVQGTLPPGLTLAPLNAPAVSVTLSGTPTTAGTYIFTVTVSDAAATPQSVPVTYAVVVAPPPLRLVVAFPAGTDGQDYIGTATATGGTPPYTFSLTGSLPGGLRAASDGNVLTVLGIPSQEGGFPVTITVRDAASAVQVVTQAVTIFVARAPASPIVIPERVVNGRLGEAYFDRVIPTGGRGSLTVTFIGNPPPGLRFFPDGRVSGTPIQAGTFQFTVVVEDGEQRESRTVTLVVLPAPVRLTTATVAPGTVAVGYSASFAATGGTPPYRFEVAGGSLPGGFTLAPTGELTGTPAAAGQFDFSVRVTDAAGQQDVRSYTLFIDAALVITTELSNLTVGTAVSRLINVTGGTPSYRCAVVSGSLPAGVTVTDACLFMGTPATAGEFPFAIQATDSRGRTTTRAYVLQVVAALEPLTLTVSVATPDLAAGETARFTVSASGGRGSYTLSGAGNVPPGLEGIVQPISTPTLAALPGELSGQVTGAGEFSFTFVLTDGAGQRATSVVQLTVQDALRLLTASLPGAVLGVPYTARVQAAGGRPPYTYRLVTEGVQGLTISQDGTITGTPIGTAAYALTVEVQDAAGRTVQGRFTGEVTLAPVSAQTFGPLPATAQPRDQVQLSLSLAQRYPVELRGTLTLNFTPDTVNGGGDGTLSFATGGRTVEFTIFPDGTDALFDPAANPPRGVPRVGVQFGTVAGTITITGVLREPTTNRVVATLPTQTIRINRAAPSLTGVQIRRTATGVDVTVSGLVTSREVTEGVFRFLTTNAAGVQGTEFTLPLTDVFAQFFRTPTAEQTGSQFTLTLPFSIQGGDASVITGVVVTLRNREGSSNSVEGRI